MTIWKFIIDGDGIIEIPHTHRVLSVGEQDGRIIAWALVDANAPTIRKSLHVVGTGWKGWYLDGIMTKRFIGTVQMSDGLVWHVFEDQ